MESKVKFTSFNESTWRKDESASSGKNREIIIDRCSTIDNIEILYLQLIMKIAKV